MFVYLVIIGYSLIVYQLFINYLLIIYYKECTFVDVRGVIPLYHRCVTVVEWYNTQYINRDRIFFMPGFVLNTTTVVYIHYSLNIY